MYRRLGRVEPSARASWLRHSIRRRLHSFSPSSRSIDPSANIAAQFVFLGLISVALNTCVDLLVTYWAAKARAGLVRRPSFVAKTRKASGAVMCGLGAALLFARGAGY